MSNYKNTNHKYIILPLYIRLSSIALIYKKHIHYHKYITLPLYIRLSPIALIYKKHIHSRMYYTACNIYPEHTRMYTLIPTPSLSEHTHQPFNRPRF